VLYDWRVTSLSHTSALETARDGCDIDKVLGHSPACTSLGDARENGAFNCVVMLESVIMMLLSMHDAPNQHNSQAQDRYNLN
jgi:hypothetical protein